MTVLARPRVAFLVGCLALVTIYLTWWVAYAQIHQWDRFSQLAPGRAAEFEDGTVRVVSFGLADGLVRSSGGDPVIADPDAVWVVATVEVLSTRESDRIWCAMDLVSTDGRIWPKGGPSIERALPNCPGDFVVGQPYRFEVIYTAPRRAAGSLAGLALTDPISVSRTPVIRP